MVFSSQYSSVLKALISFWRWTIMANVGVWTRPTDKVILSRPNLRVYNRVPLMPSTQSPTAREFPAAKRLSNSLESRNLLNPSLMASSVREEIHKRFTGTLHFALMSTQRWINSPSCPASPQLMTSSACVIKVSMTLNWRFAPSSSRNLMPNWPGIIGKSSNFQYFQFGL